MPAQELADALAARSPSDQDASVESPQERTPPAIQVDYYNAPEQLPAGPALATVCFGEPPAASAAHAGLDIGVQLTPLYGSPHVERWAASGPVASGELHGVRYAMDDRHLFAELQLEESAHGGPRATAAKMYAEILRFQMASGFPHLLRMWNYLDAINDGRGDLERYREFCVGRAQALGGALADRFPAATAIGRQTPTGLLQVFWLACKQPGAPLENPRQVSAYRYPRRYGPVGPSFSRAAAAPDGALLISGTASIVGHLSRHHDDVHAQLEETLCNLQVLMTHAQVAATGRELFKVYVRRPEQAEAIVARLAREFPNSATLCVAADICRRELLLEIEGLRLA